MTRVEQPSPAPTPGPGSDSDAPTREPTKFGLKDFTEKHKAAIERLRSIRRRPLLVMYYPEPNDEMRGEDVEMVYSELRRVGWTRESPVKELDVLLHTNGGDPQAAYRIGQAIRDAASKVDMLVPVHGYSAGTLLAFCANSIRLGDNAGLSPIDTTLLDTQGGVELLSLDYFRNFAIECRITMEKELLRGVDADEISEDAESDVESKLLVEMVAQVGALDLGRFFRNRELASEYARSLLLDYMLRGEHDAPMIAERAIQGFLHRAPSHEFHMDFHLVKRFELPVVEMSVAESDAAKAVVKSLEEGAASEVVCKPIRPRYALPFIQVYTDTGLVVKKKKR